VGGAYVILRVGDLIDETGTPRTVQRDFANPSGTGNTEVVAAQGAGVRIRVLSFFIVTTAANSVKFQSATTDISPTCPFAANGGIAQAGNPHGEFQTAVNEALNVNLSVATATGINVVWVQAT